MKFKGMLFSLLLGTLIVFVLPASAQVSTPNHVSGEYLEARTADVYTGPCFANSEVNLTGNEAVLAWHIEKGHWGKVALDALAVVAVVRANATIGDPFANPLPAKTVFIVDARANEAQRAALVRFAQAQTGGLLRDVVAVESSPVRFVVDPNRHGYATLEVKDPGGVSRTGNLVTISTRAIGSADELCHNEEVYYPPLAANLNHSMPAVAAESTYRGNHLGVTWTDSGRRSSFVGTFSF